MARREYRTTFRCAEPGCDATQFYTSTTRADEAALYKQQKAVPFRCTRHRNPEQNLRPGNEHTTYVLVARRLPSRARPDDFLPGLFWVPEGQERGGSGFTFGGGYNAHAKDFPEGTRLVITAQIETPDPASSASGGAGKE